MAWIQIDQSLPQNRKLYQLKTTLRIDTSKAIGILALLWIWALDNSKDGLLGGVSDLQLAEICGFSLRRGSELREALVGSGFLDSGGEGLSIHSWGDYSGKLTKSREYYRNYRRKTREAQRASLCSTEVQAIDKTKQEETKQEETKPDKTRQDETENISDAAAGGDACASEAEDYLLSRGLVPESWFGQGPELTPKVRHFADSLFKGIWAKPPGPTDYGRVFNCVVDIEEVDGEQRCTYSERRAELLLYAFEAATAAGMAGRWDYVYGVLRRLRERGISDLGEAEQFELNGGGE